MIATITVLNNSFKRKEESWRRNRRRLAQLFPVLSLSFGSTLAGDFSTPEAAFHEYQSAWAHRDIQQFLSTISFKQEAREILQVTAPAGTTPSEADVAQLAAQREHELEDRLRRVGFKPDDLPTCKIIAKRQDTKSSVRFPLTCSMSHGYMFYTIRLVRVDAGWRVVRH